MKLLFSSIFGIIGFILLLTGCPLLLSAGGIYYYSDYSVRDWPTTTATITALRESQTTDSSGFSSTVYCPSIEYTPAGGQLTEVDLNDCSFPPAGQVGETVQVAYNPQAPEQVRLQGGVANTLANIGAGVVGGLGCILMVVGLGMGIVALVVAARKSRAAPEPSVPNPASSAAEQVLQAEREWVEAHRRLDLAALDRLMADDYAQVRADGTVIGKGAALASYATGDRHWDYADSDEYDLRVYGEAAVLIGRWRARGRNAGEAFDYAARFVAVYVRRDDRWQIAADQTTTIPTP